MTDFTIQPYESHHRAWAEAFLLRAWGSPVMVSRGVLYNVVAYPGFVGMVDGQAQALLTYRINDDQCEVLMIHSAVEGIGMGSALMEAAEQVARAAGCGRLWLVTTNDNIRAFRWYQRRGFVIAAVHVNALAESRRLKPDIPLTGHDGIPLRDEIEFEKALR